MASELCPRGLDILGVVQDFSEYLLAPGKIADNTRPLAPSARRYPWNGILGVYCDVGLSFPDKDKLRAIQGLAERHP